MSKQIGTVKGPHKIELNQYAGSDPEGLCIQITGYNCDRQLGYVSMTYKEAREVAGLLLRWARWMRRYQR